MFHGDAVALRSEVANGAMSVEDERWFSSAEKYGAYRADDQLSPCNLIGDPNSSAPKFGAINQSAGLRRRDVKFLGIASLP